MRAASMKSLSNHARGVLLAVIGITLLSPDSLLIRLMEATDMTVLVLRGVFATTMLVILWWWVRRRDQRPGAAGKLSERSAGDRRAEIIYALIWALGAACFVTSIRHTLVANTLIILALIPLFAAVIAVFWLRESPRPHTWLVIIGCLLSVSLIFGVDLNSGHFFGDAFALAAAVLLAFNFCILRRRPRLSPVRGLMYGGLFSTFIALPLADLSSIVPLDYIYGSLLGGIIVPFSFLLLSFSCRLIQPAEVGLIMLLEMLIAPLMVWAVIGEVPELLVVVAGVLILVLLALDSWLTLRQRQQPPPLPARAELGDQSG